MNGRLESLFEESMKPANASAAGAEFLPLRWFPVENSKGTLPPIDSVEPRARHASCTDTLPRGPRSHPRACKAAMRCRLLACASRRRLILSAGS